MCNTKIIITIIIKGKIFHYQRNGEQEKSIELRVNGEGNNNYQKFLHFIVTGTTETTKKKNPK